MITTGGNCENLPISVEVISLGPFSVDSLETNVCKTVRRVFGDEPFYRDPIKWLVSEDTAHSFADVCFQAIYGKGTLKKMTSTDIGKFSQ